jgi:heat-inducible transcriptional repressor
MPDEGIGTRKGTVLRAVVTEHIRTGEPVGSGAVVTRYHLRVSPATIRNDMSALEDLGYLAQPHTSAGRIPTDHGYRYYVDTSPRAAQLREAHRQAIDAFFGGAQPDLDEVVRGTTQLLSELTNHAAIALAPSLSESTIVRLDLMRMGPALLLLVIANTGRVEKRVVESATLPTHAAVEALGQRAEEAAAGRTLSDAAAAVTGLAQAAAGPDGAIFEALAASLNAIAVATPSGDVILGGAGNLAAEAGFERRESIRQLFDALDRHTEMTDLLRTASDAPDVTVTIGEENPLPSMHHASLVIASYRVGDRPLGSIGVLGPTRMDYLQAISAVRAVSRHLSEATRPTER